MWKSHQYLVLAAALLATTAVHSFAQEAELLAVLHSDATLQEKSAACRQLARIATKEAVPTLAALLGDEKLSHMARYALEGIRDPSVDAALRDALGKVQGQPRLGVIGSLGARRDAQAVGALAGLLKETVKGNFGIKVAITKPQKHPRLDALLEMIGQIQKHAPAGSMLVVEAADPFDMALLPGGPIGSKRYTAWQVRTYAPAVVGVWRG